MLSIECSRQITAFESVDDLNRALVSGVFQELEDAALYDDVLQIELLQFAYGNRRDELRIAILLRIGRVQTSFVLHENHGPGSQDFANQIAAGVCSVRRNAAH